MNATDASLSTIELDRSVFVTGMRWGPDGALYAAAHAAGSIERIDASDGSVETVAEGGLLDRPIALDALSDGTLVVIDGGPAEQPGDRGTWLEGPRVLTVDPATGESELLVTDPRFTGADGEDWFDLVATPTDEIYLVTGRSDPRVLTLQDSSDDEGAGALWRIDPATGDHELVATHPSWVFPDGLEVLEDGRIFLSDWASEQPGTYIVDPGSGEVERIADPPGASFLWGGELLPDGRVVVSDASGDPPGADETCQCGGLWTVDPATGESEFLARTPADGSSGHARLVPPG